MDDISFKKRKKRNSHVFEQEESKHFKYIKKESSEENYVKRSPQKNLISSEKDSESQEFVYFEKILDTLKTGIPDESKALFVSNALEECQGREIELSCHHSTSRCIETLLSFCTDIGIWRQFMTSFSVDKVTICTNPSASHIVELLIQFALKNLRDWSSIMDSDNERKSDVSFFLLWIVELGDFVLEHFTSCLEDQYAAHVATSVIRALGGDMSGSSDYMSKKLTKRKKESFFGNNEETSHNDTSVEEIVLESIPKEFKEKLKLISKCVRKVENISDYVSESYSALVIEALVSIMAKRSPKQCRKLIKNLSINLFAVKDDYGVPICFLQKNSSFVIEKMFQAADEELQTELWNQYIEENLEHLITHRISNFIVQRLFDSVKTSALLQVMSEKAGALFDKIFEAEKFGILLSIASACKRLKSHQALFMKNIMQCLQCNEPQERQLKLVPLLLGLNKYDDSKYVKNSELSIYLQGSLLVQNLLSFQKPIKLVNSLLDTKPQFLSTLACHLQGCHVLTAFFKSDTVGEKNKDKLTHSLKPVATNIACDENGSLTISRIWVLLSLKQKGVIADALVRDEEKLKANRKGNVVFNKFKIFQYKRNFEQWKELQLQFLKQKK